MSNVGLTPSHHQATKPQSQATIRGVRAFPGDNTNINCGISVDRCDVAQTWQRCNAFTAAGNVDAKNDHRPCYSFHSDCRRPGAGRCRGLDHKPDRDSRVQRRHAILVSSKRHATPQITLVYREAYRYDWAWLPPALVWAAWIIRKRSCSLLAVACYVAVFVKFKGVGSLCY